MLTKKSSSVSLRQKTLVAVESTRVAEVELITRNWVTNFISGETQKAYLSDLRDLILFAGSKNLTIEDPNQISEKLIIEYRNYLLERYSPTSINRKLSALSSFMGHLKEEGIIRKNPVTGIRRPKAIAKRQRTGFTDKEVNLILRSFDMGKLSEHNEKALFSFLFYTGVRVSEALSVKVKDLDQQQGLPVVHIKGKGQKLRTLPIIKVAPILRDLIAQRQKRPDDYVFTSARSSSNSPMHRTSVHKAIKRLQKRLELDSSRSAHSTRRTLISKLLESGERLELVQKVAGHSSPNVTLRCYNVREEPLEKNPLNHNEYRD